MEIILLCFTAMLIAMFFEKKSKYLALAHAVCFIILLFVSFFTSDLENARLFTEKIFGSEIYIKIREILTEPCEFAYSAYGILILAELLFAGAVLIGVTAEIVKKIKSKERNILRSGKEEKEKIIREEEIFGGDKIYLKLCRLLN